MIDKKPPIDPVLRAWIDDTKRRLAEAKRKRQADPDPAAMERAERQDLYNAAEESR